MSVKPWRMGAFRSLPKVIEALELAGASAPVAKATTQSAVAAHSRCMDVLPTINPPSLGGT